MTSPTLEDEAAALATCESEPIRTPDRIQGHGTLLACDLKLGPITHVSDNTETLFGTEGAMLLGTPLAEILTEDDAHQLRNIVTRSSTKTQRHFLGTLSLPGGRKAVGMVHRRGARVILELTATRTADTDADTNTKTDTDTDESIDPVDLQRLRWLVDRQHQGQSLQESLEAMTQDLRAICGFDRVMIYRFRPDGSGEVLAESCAPDMDSYVGLRFPSFDMPQTARAIAVEQPIRAIADTAAEDVAILGLEPNGEPLDMTLAALRGTSPVHATYLRNMGAGASLTFSMIVDNRLWGIFSCQHRTRKVLSAEETMVLDLAGQMLNVSINTGLRGRLSKALADCELETQQLERDTNADSKTLFSPDSWEAFAGWLHQTFRADGARIRCNGRSHQSGLQPMVENFDAMDSGLSSASSEPIFANDSLLSGHRHESETDLEAVAGMMRIDLFPHLEASLWLFRREENTVVEWAGAPQKQIERTEAETRLHPRSSFQAYAEESKGSSIAWEPEEVELAEALQSSLRAVIDRQLHRTASEAKLDLMVQELNHRVRNILTLTRSLVRQSANDKDNVHEYIQSLEARLFALVGAHDLLALAGPAGLDIETSARRELGPYIDRVESLSGPDVKLTPSASTVFVLVMHEVVTNATKYGALSQPEGRVMLTWKLGTDGLEVHWREKHGPPVSSPAELGFGHFMIQEAVTHQLDGRSSVEFRSEGVEVFLHVPSKHIIPPSNSEPVITLPDPPVRSTLGRQDNLGRVLILEDDYLIARESKLVLEAAGATSEVVICGSNASALNLLEGVLDGQLFDCAVIDVNLGERDSYPTASRLKELNVPFVFMTGYEGRPNWAGDFSQVPVLRKPVLPDDLTAALAAVVAEAADDLAPPFDPEVTNEGESVRR